MLSVRIGGQEYDLANVVAAHPADVAVTNAGGGSALLAANPARVKLTLFNIGANPARVRLDGGVPTATTGLYLPANTPWEGAVLTQDLTLLAIKAIGVGGSTTICVTEYTGV